MQRNVEYTCINNVCKCSLSRMWQRRLSLSPALTLDCCNDNLHLWSKSCLYSLIFSPRNKSKLFFGKKKEISRRKHRNGCQQHWCCVINRTCTKLEKNILSRDSSDGVCVCVCVCVRVCVREWERRGSQQQ